MKYITDKIVWTEAMKNYAEELTQKRMKRFVDNPVDNTTIRLTKLNNNSIKVSVYLDTFRVQEVDSDFYTAMSRAMSKMKQLITRYREKYNSKKQHDSIKDIAQKITDDESKILNVITKEKIFNLQEIAIEEAISEIEQTDYSFYIFKDISVGGIVTVLYRRFNGTYGVIRCH